MESTFLQKLIETGLAGLLMAGVMIVVVKPLLTGMLSRLAAADTNAERLMTQFKEDQDRYLVLQEKASDLARQDRIAITQAFQTQLEMARQDRLVVCGRHADYHEKTATILQSVNDSMATLVRSLAQKETADAGKS